MTGRVLCLCIKHACFPLPLSLASPCDFISFPWCKCHTVGWFFLPPPSSSSILHPLLPQLSSQCESASKWSSPVSHSFSRIDLATKKWCCCWYLKRNRLIDIYWIITLIPSWHHWSSLSGQESHHSQWVLSWMPWQPLTPPPPLPSPLVSGRCWRGRLRPCALWLALLVVAPDYCLQRHPLVVWAESTWPTLAPYTVSPLPPEQG